MNARSNARGRPDQVRPDLVGDQDAIEVDCALGESPRDGQPSLPAPTAASGGTSEVTRQVEAPDSLGDRVDHPSKEGRWFCALELASVAGLGLFIAAVVALHGLRRDLNPAEHTMSEYSLGSYGWLMRAAFGTLGVGVLATAASLRHRCELPPWRGVGIVLLVGTAGGLFLDAAYNTDRLGVAETPDGAVHAAGTWIIFLTLPFAAVLLGSDVTGRAVGPRQSTWLQILGPAQVVALVGFKISPLAYRGLAERTGIVFALITLAALQSEYLPSPGWRLGHGPESVGSRQPSSYQIVTPLGDRLAPPGLEAPVPELDFVDESGVGDLAKGA